MHDPKEHHLMLAFQQLANYVAFASKCGRAKHGCVLTDMDLQVISYGYNGVARGLPNGCIRNEKGNCGCVHAEQNAVAKAGNPSTYKIAFVTCQPCERCASILVNNGVCMVVYQAGHRDYPEGLLIFDRLGIPHGTVNEMYPVLRGVNEQREKEAREGTNGKPSDPQRPSAQFASVRKVLRQLRRTASGPVPRIRHNPQSYHGITPPPGDGKETP